MRTSIKCYPTVEAMQHIGQIRGKFVQLNWKQAPWLLLASKDQHAFHNQILAHFLSEQHLPFHWHSPERLEFESAQLEILGGGKFLLDWDESTLTLCDNSMVYGRFDEAQLRDSLRHVGMPWAGLSITIE